MHHDELDDIFSRDQDLMPSSGFVASVMDEVRQTAAAPPPIPFPWKRAVPGFAAGVFAFGSMFVLSAASTSAYDFGAILRITVSSGSAWIGLTLLLTAVSVIPLIFYFTFADTHKAN